MAKRTWHSYRKREARPGDVVDLVDYDDGVFWNQHLYDRWPLIVKLSFCSGTGQPYLAMSVTGAMTSLR